MKDHELKIKIFEKVLENFNEDENMVQSLVDLCQEIYEWVTEETMNNESI